MFRVSIFCLLALQNVYVAGTQRQNESEIQREFPAIRLNHTSPDWNQVIGAFSDAQYSTVNFSNLTYGFKKEVDQTAKPVQESEIVRRVVVSSGEENRKDGRRGNIGIVMVICWLDQLQQNKIEWMREVDCRTTTIYLYIRPAGSSGCTAAHHLDLIRALNLTCTHVYLSTGSTVGRHHADYLGHIISHYHRLETKMVFLKGVDHASGGYLHAYRKLRKTTNLGFRCLSKKTRSHFGLTVRGFYHAQEACDVLHRYTGATQCSYFFVCWNAIFAVHYRRILSLPLSEYVRLLAFANSSPENFHGMENYWSIIFGCVHLFKAVSNMNISGSSSSTVFNPKNFRIDTLEYPGHYIQCKSGTSVDLVNVLHQQNGSFNQMTVGESMVAGHDNLSKCDTVPSWLGRQDYLYSPWFRNNYATDSKLWNISCYRDIITEREAWQPVETGEWPRVSGLTARIYIASQRFHKRRKQENMASDISDI